MYSHEQQYTSHIVVCVSDYKHSHQTTRQLAFTKLQLLWQLFVIKAKATSQPLPPLKCVGFYLVVIRSTCTESQKSITWSITCRGRSRKGMGGRGGSTGRTLYEAWTFNDTLQVLSYLVPEQIRTGTSHSASLVDITEKITSSSNI